LLDAASNRPLKSAYRFLLAGREKLGLPIPVNSNLNTDTDLLIRRLDCAVINSLHDLMEQQGGVPFDSVRAAFIEGKPVYPHGTFRQKNHVQICVRNLAAIKGYFHVLPKR
jgi:hypothetical protein